MTTSQHSQSRFNGSHLSAGNRALREKRYAAAITLYLKALRTRVGLSRVIADNLRLAQQRYRRQSRFSPRLRVAVCGWSLGHDSAGRVYTLAQIYQTLAETEIIGSLFPRHGGPGLWIPIRDTRLPVHTLVVEDEERFLDQAIELVAGHPYDLVHLSKPRASNIFIGILYKLIWGARVILDIDDEELAFVGAEAPLGLDVYCNGIGHLPPLRDLDGRDWTRIAVGLATAFDGVTVSSPALRQRYGGHMVRPERVGAEVGQTGRQVFLETLSFKANRPVLGSIAAQRIPAQTRLQPALGRILLEHAVRSGLRFLLDAVSPDHERGVSVVILTRDGASLLDRLLRTFFANNSHHPLEIIIIDHGSTDGTASVVAEHLGACPVWRIDRGGNYSFSNSCNLGAAKAFYPYLLFLNNDILYTADVLPAALSALDDPRIGAVGVRLDDDPEALPQDQEPRVQHTGVEFVWHERRGYFRPAQIRHPSVRAYLEQAAANQATAGGDAVLDQRQPAVTGAFLLCRKTDFEALNGFREDYDYGLEDIDFCLRLGRDLSKDCYCINRMSLQHREGATRKRDDRAASMKNNHRIFKATWDHYIRERLVKPRAVQISELTPKLQSENGCVRPAPAVQRRPAALNILFVLYHAIDSNSGLHVQLHAARLLDEGADCLFAVPDQQATSAASQMNRAVHSAILRPAGARGRGERQGSERDVGDVLLPALDNRLGYSRVRPYSAFLPPDGRLPFADGRGPDIIHAWTPREVVRRFVEELRGRQPCPVVIHLEDNEEYLTEVSVGRPFAELTRLSASELDRLIPANRYHPTRGRTFLDQAQGLTLIIGTLERFNIRKTPTMVLPPPVDERLFYPRPFNRALRHELGVPDDHVVLAYTGNRHRGNQAEIGELYQAVEMLNRQGCPTVLFRTGLDGKARNGALSTESPYEKNLGWVERQRVPEILAAADMLVQPGEPGPFNDERIPSKLPEYFAMGRPVILPRTNLGLRVTHAQHAYVVEKADASSIAEAVRTIRSDRALWRRLSDQGVEFYLSRFARELMSTSLSDYYGQLQRLGGTGPYASSSGEVLPGN